MCCGCRDCGKDTAQQAGFVYQFQSFDNKLNEGHLYIYFLKTTFHFSSVRSLFLTFD